MTTYYISVYNNSGRVVFDKSYNNYYNFFFANDDSKNITILFSCDNFEDMVKYYKQNICKPDRMSSLSKEEFSVIQSIWDNYRELL
jgi:hypothetical protein